MYVLRSEKDLNSEVSLQSFI